MSIFLGGNNLGPVEAEALTTKVDSELSRATSNLKPHLDKISAFHAVFNQHTPGMRAGRTIAKFVELGQPAIVFQEEVGIHGGSYIEHKTALSIDASNSPTIKDSYSRQVIVALGLRGSTVFPVDARHELLARMEAIVQCDINADFFNTSERFNLESLTNMTKEELMARELETLNKFSFVMGIRDKSAVLQMLTFLAGVLNYDHELLGLMGLEEETAKRVLQKTSKKVRNEGFIEAGSVYGSAHTGITVLLKSSLGRQKVKTHRLHELDPYLARDAYADYYLQNREDVEELAARSLIEDFFFIPTHPSYVDQLRVLPTASDNTFIKLAKEYCRGAGGPTQALEHITVEEATKIALDRGLLIKV